MYLILPATHNGPGVYSDSNKMSTRKDFWGKERAARKADNLPVIYEPIV
jgi:hypothetical protein